MPTMDDDEKLIAALRSYKQADADGVMCVVSRQAVHEAADRLSALKAERDLHKAHVGMLHITANDDAELIARLKAERDRMAAALGKLADDARWWKMPEVENQEYIADACMAMLRLMRACARAALSQEPTPHRS